MTWLSWLVLASALVAMGADLAYMIKFPKGNKWALRFTDAVAVAYFGAIYLMMGLEQFELDRYGPQLIRPGILMLLLLLAAEPIYDIWRRPPAR